MKQRAMKLPSTQTIVLNGAAILIFGASLIAAARSTLFKAPIAPCTERYLRSTTMALDRGGRAMHINDLQSHLSGTDWNLLDNARVVNLRSGPAKQALEVKTVVQRPAGSEDAKPGVGFVWTPSSLPRDTTAACLAYQVFLPEGFDLGAGGRLPGFLGRPESDGGQRPQGFSTRVHFDERGRIDIVGDLPERQQGNAIGSPVYPGRLEAGAWTAIEQELILNAPGARDGIIRLWVNGTLGFEAKAQLIRKDDQTSISGVLAEVTHRLPAKTEAKQAAIWLSPFDIRWGETKAP